MQVGYTRDVEGVKPTKTAIAQGKRVQGWVLGTSARERQRPARGKLPGSWGEPGGKLPMDRGCTAGGWGRAEERRRVREATPAR